MAIVELLVLGEALLYVGDTMLDGRPPVDATNSGVLDEVSSTVVGVVLVPELGPLLCCVGRTELEETSLVVATADELADELAAAEEVVFSLVSLALTRTLL